MGAKDYMVDVADIPKYGPPNMAAQLYSMIRGVPQAFEEGRENQFKQGQRQRTEELQKPYTGPMTPQGIMQESIKRGGIAEAQNYIQPLLGMQASDAISRAIGGGGEKPSRSDPSARADAQTPAPLRAASAAQADKTGVNAPGEPPGRNDDVTSLRGLATQYQIDVDSPAFKKAFGGIPLDREDFHPTVVGALDQRLRDFAQAQRDAGGGATASLGPGSTALPGAGGMAGGAPAPPVGQSGAPPVQMAQAGPAGPAGPPQASPLGTLRDAEALEARGNKRLQAAAHPFAPPAAAKAAEAAAAQDFAQAKEIRAANTKAEEQRRESELGVRAAEAKGNREADLKEAVALKSHIFKSGQAAQDLLPQLEMARRLTNAPGFNSGLGHQLFDTVRSLSQQIFGGTELKNPGEIYDKFRSGFALNEIRELGASGVGAVRVPEMKMVDKMIADREVSAPGIRAVTETEMRLQKRVHDLYQMAQDYLKTHRELDKGFESQANAYKEKHELFSKEELAHPELISRPVFASPEEMRASKMPRGTKFRTPDGGHGEIP